MMLSLNLVFLFLIVGTDSLATTRRAFVGTAASAYCWSSFSAPAMSSDIASKLEQNILVIPQPTYNSELNGIDNLYYPKFLEGEWEVRQTLVESSFPLGLKFVGGPSGDIEIAKKTSEEARSNIGKPINLRLRFQSTKWGVAEDRIFNSKQRLNAFAGKDVVASVQYADVGGSNRKSVLMLGGKQEDPLETSVVYFKGPAAQKNFVVSHDSKENPSANTWVGYELQRSIFALTNTSTVPPVTTDTEFIWKLEKIDDQNVVGKLRIASYLNAQTDKFYFEARNRAVSLQDYTLDMKRIE